MIRRMISAFTAATEYVPLPLVERLPDDWSLGALFSTMMRNYVHWRRRAGMLPAMRGSTGLPAWEEYYGELHTTAWLGEKHATMFCLLADRRATRIG